MCVSVCVVALWISGLVVRVFGFTIKPRAANAVQSGWIRGGKGAVPFTTPVTGNSFISGEYGGKPTDIRTQKTLNIEKLHYSHDG